MEEETLAFRSVNRERQGWRSAWPKKPAEPDEWTPPRSWRIRVYYARSRCVSRCVSWTMSARANQWTNSSRVFSPLRHGIQHRRRSLMILCEIVIPIQIGMERNITTNPCFVPISISFSANASTDSRVKIPRLPHRSIFEYFPNRVPDRVRETVVDLLIHLGTEKQRLDSSKSIVVTFSFNFILSFPRQISTDSCFLVITWKSYKVVRVLCFH